MLGCFSITTLLNLISQSKNLYGRFGETSDGLREYYLKLDGYYYCSKQKKDHKNV